MKIENIIASAKIANNLDLQKIKSSLPNNVMESYIPPTLIFLPDKLKTSILLFDNGTAFFTGAKSLYDLHTTVDILGNELKKIDIEINKNPEFNFHNILVSEDLNKEIDLIKITLTLGLEYVEYFPDDDDDSWLLYRVRKDTSCLVFDNGKIFCSGYPKGIDEAKEIVKKAVDTINKILDEK